MANWGLDPGDFNYDCERKEPSVEKGKVREWTLAQSSSFDDEMVIKSGPVILHTEPEVRVREVINLTDEEKRLVEWIRENMEMGGMARSERVLWLISLLERAGVC